MKKNDILMAKNIILRLKALNEFLKLMLLIALLIKLQMYFPKKLQNIKIVKLKKITILFYKI